jgi:hypothetical protein
MWSRRAQEYEAKINSGDIMALAEVVRDLYRSDRQPEQSYSERQLFEAALDRFAREVAAVKKLTEPAAVAEIEEVLEGSSARRSEKAAEIEAAEIEPQAVSSGHDACTPRRLVDQQWCCGRHARLHRQRCISGWDRKQSPSRNGRAAWSGSRGA